MADDERTKMLSGRLYRADDPELQAMQAAATAWLARFNAPAPRSAEASRALLVERLAHVGEGTLIRPPFHCDYGSHIHLGAGVFINFGCVILDVAMIWIGDRARIGPAVQIYAADHPRDAATRRRGLESGKSVRIGADVWIGGGAIVLPGITIGAGAVVGAGSVVTRNVPAGASVMGNPARVRKEH